MLITHLLFSSSKTCINYQNYHLVIATNRGIIEIISNPFPTYILSDIPSCIEQLNIDNNDNRDNYRLHVDNKLIIFDNKSYFSSSTLV